MPENDIIAGVSAELLRGQDCAEKDPVDGDAQRDLSNLGNGGWIIREMAPSTYAPESAPAPSNGSTHRGDERNHNRIAIFPDQIEFDGCYYRREK